MKNKLEKFIPKSLILGIIGCIVCIIVSVKFYDGAGSGAFAFVCFLCAYGLWYYNREIKNKTLTEMFTDKADDCPLD